MRGSKLGSRGRYNSKVTGGVNGELERSFKSSEKIGVEDYSK
jgi:hypothetical protein